MQTTHKKDTKLKLLTKNKSCKIYLIVENALILMLFLHAYNVFIFKLPKTKSKGLSQKSL